MVDFSSAVRGDLRNILSEVDIIVPAKPDGREFLHAVLALFYWIFAGLREDFVTSAKKGSCGFHHWGLDTASPKRNGRRNEANGSESGRKRGSEDGKGREIGAT